jgi:hypothetical protein
MKSVLLSAAIITLFFAPMRAFPATADPLNPTYVACLLGPDDYREAARCENANWDAAFLCGRPLETVAASICNIHTPHGVISIPHDPPVKLHDPGGGACGYPSYKITCHFPTGTQILYDTHRANAIAVGCGQSADDLALSLCQKIKTPTTNYGDFTVWDQGREHCGFTNIDVKCYN